MPMSMLYELWSEGKMPKLNENLLILASRVKRHTPTRDWEELQIQVEFEERPGHLLVQTLAEQQEGSTWEARPGCYSADPRRVRSSIDPVGRKRTQEDRYRSQLRVVSRVDRVRPKERHRTSRSASRVVC